MDILNNILIIIGALVAFVLFWSVIVWIIAQMAGWPKLAEKYPGRAPWSPQCWSLQSALFRGWAQYRSVLRVCADSEALHLSAIFPFSVANKPLSIPWYEIRGQKKRRWLYYAVELHFQQVPNVPVHIRLGLADHLVAATGGKWQYEEG